MILLLHCLLSLTVAIRHLKAGMAGLQKLDWRESPLVLGCLDKNLICAIGIVQGCHRRLRPAPQTLTSPFLSWQTRVGPSPFRLLRTVPRDPRTGTCSLKTQVRVNSAPRRKDVCDRLCA